MRSHTQIHWSHWHTYPVLVIFWLLHWLPLPVLRALGAGLGRLFYWFGRERGKVARTNLRLCFPEKSEAEREAIVKAQFRLFAQAFLDRSWLWWSREARLRRLITLQGQVHLDNLTGKPTIILASHFVGLDVGGTCLTMMSQRQFVNVYSKQKNPVLDDLLRHGRSRFNAPRLLSRQDGMRGVIKALKEGCPFYYLPDMDYGPQDSIFVPFFGVQAATIPALSRLVRLTKAEVVPCITRMSAHGYTVELQPAWQDFPGESVEEDTRRMNAFIEQEVRRMPEQYFWLHKRFKTRPPGEGRFY